MRGDVSNDGVLVVVMTEVPLIVSVSTTGVVFTGVVIRIVPFEIGRVAFETPLVGEMLLVATPAADVVGYVW